MKRSVRPLKLGEIDLVINYFTRADRDYLRGLGVDPAKVPEPRLFRAILTKRFIEPVEQKKAFYVLWELDDAPIGFSSIDRIAYGIEAFIHLHLLNSDQRMQGHGAEFVRHTVRMYFETFDLLTLFCEPYAFNEAPNRTLQRAGFKYVKTYETVPGPLNFPQPVTRWELARPRLDALLKLQNL